MSDTPRTDDLEMDFYGVKEEEVIDYHALLRRMAAHARTLERERNALFERVAATHGADEAKRTIVEVNGPSTGESPQSSPGGPPECSTAGPGEGICAWEIASIRERVRVPQVCGCCTNRTAAAAEGGGK